MKLTLLRSILLTVAMVLANTFVVAQSLTTSQIAGVTTSKTGEPLPGATIKAVHVPSGTAYGTISNEAGRFTIPNMRVGGPYTITVDYVGFQQYSTSDVYLQLGQTFTLNAQLSDNSVSLSEVVIAATRGGTISSQRTGAFTSVNSTQLTELPTLNRSINDFTRLTPQAGGGGFAGRNGRFTNFSLDGAMLNNAFGLNDNPLPGAGASTQPISLDAIEQLAVAIAPYDVRQGGFTGAGVNLVTRSGTNEFSGSAYYFWSNQGLIGTTVGGQRASQNSFDLQQYGFRIGGPIIKDKVFFFVSAEATNREEAALNFRPRRADETGGQGGVSLVQADSMRQLRDLLVNTYGYDPGAFEDFNYVNEDEKIFLRLDWNVNQNHKLSARFNYVNGSNDIPPSNSTIANGFGSSRSNSINYVPFQGTGYTFNTELTTASLEWNATFGTRFSNQLIVTGTFIREPRSTLGRPFPMVDIGFVPGPGQSASVLATSIGTEQFSQINVLNQDQYMIQNNFNFYFGKHTFLGGIQVESYSFLNQFQPQRYGRYTFRSFRSFFENVAAAQTNTPLTPFQQPAAFNLTSALPGQTSDVELEAIQWSAYLQDEYSALPNLRITAGVRVDVPTYQTTPAQNQLVQEFGINTANLPSGQVMWSPRLGANWDVFNNRKLQVRGGTGVFTGRIPFVWMSNNVSNTGARTTTATSYPSGAASNTRFFNPNIPSVYAPVNATASGASEINYAAPNFRFTQVWRTSLGVDYAFGEGFIATLEGAYTQDLNAVYHTNQALSEATTQVPLGPNNTPTITRFVSNSRPTSTTPVNNFTRLMELRNADQGYSYFITGQLQKTFSDNLYFSAAYTYTVAEDVSSNPGSQAYSAWQFSPALNPNQPELAPSAFVVPHRFIASAWYKLNYSKYAATTISAFYELQSGNRYSYTYRYSQGVNSINNDGTNNNDLMYVPRSAEEINLVADGLRTPAQQWAQLDAFISQDPYLNERRGQFTERNGAITPAIGRLDLRLLQDFYFDVKGKRNTLQLTLDIINFGNLLNDDWGVAKLTLERQPLQIVGYDPSGVPQMVFVQRNAANNIALSESFTESFAISSRWQVQFGVRYIFN